MLFFVTPLVEGGSLRQRLRSEGKVATGGGGPDRPRGGRRPGVRPRARRHPPRHQARQHPARVRPRDRADFGIARALSAAGADRVTQAGSCWDPAYMSPEQAIGEEVDARADIYGLGACSTRCSAGQPPANALLTAMAAATAVGTGRTASRCRDPRPRPRPGGSLAHRRAFGDALGRTVPQPGDRRRGIAGWRSGSRPSARGIAGGALWLAARSEERRTTPVTRLTQMTFDEAVEEFPAWSPDGRRLAFSRTVEGYRNLFVREYPSGEERQLTRGRRDDIQPSWSPDGRTIAMVRSSLASGEARARRRARLLRGGRRRVDGGRRVGTGDPAHRRRLQSELVTRWEAPRGRRRAHRAAPDLDHRSERPRPQAGDRGQLRGRGAHDAALVARWERRSCSAGCCSSGPTSWWRTSPAARPAGSRRTTSSTPVPVWSPSGRYIYFTCGRGGGLTSGASASRTMASPAGPSSSSRPAPATISSRRSRPTSSGCSPAASCG